MDLGVKKKLPEVGVRVFGEQREIDVALLPSPAEVAQRDGPSAKEAAYGEAFARRLRQEMGARRGLIGPQRDDLEIRFAGRSAGAFASAGEQRRVAFLLALAAIDLVCEAGATAPVLLVDDVEAEFDDTRLDRVLSYLAGAGQSLVATSKADLARRFAGLGTVLRVEQGQIHS